MAVPDPVSAVAVPRDSAVPRPGRHRRQPCVLTAGGAPYSSRAVNCCIQGLGLSAPFDRWSRHWNVHVLLWRGAATMATTLSLSSPLFLAAPPRARHVVSACPSWSTANLPCKGYFACTRRHARKQQRSTPIVSLFGRKTAKKTTRETRTQTVDYRSLYLVSSRGDGIVALGKFDALHIGHRELAMHASKSGNPFLLSFVGMAEVLGWEYRPPIVAHCDRKRVLSSWAPYCRNVVPVEYQVEFSKVRYLTPRQFVEKLSTDLRIKGVVAGENYRFGYKASGDAAELVKLCEEFGLSAFIVRSVMDTAKGSYNGATPAVNSSDKGQVSSSRVRQALSVGDIEYVSKLLGRKHRLVLTVSEYSIKERKNIVVPKSCMVNMPPADGFYENCELFNGGYLGLCRVVINTETIDIEMKDESSLSPDPFQEVQQLGIEFG